MTAEQDLAARLAAVEGRLDRLEARPQPGVAGGLDPEVFWALTGLRERLGDSSGEVVFTGAATLPTGEYYEWQQGAHSDGLLGQDWSELSAPLAALGHPVRLQLLRRVLHGTRTAGELQQLAEVGTTGQLYHHLRQLVAAGWLRAVGRGHYSVPEGRVIPLLVVLSTVAPGQAPGQAPSHTVEPTAE